MNDVSTFLSRKCRPRSLKNGKPQNGGAEAWERLRGLSVKFYRQTQVSTYFNLSIFDYVNLQSCEFNISFITYRVSDDWILSV